MKKNIAKFKEIENVLIGLLINTATEGKWKEWSDNFPEGEAFIFTEDMLKDTSDENLDNITFLIDNLINIKEYMNNGIKSNSLPQKKQMPAFNWYIFLTLQQNQIDFLFITSNSYTSPDFKLNDLKYCKHHFYTVFTPFNIEQCKQPILSA